MKNFQNDNWIRMRGRWVNFFFFLLYLQNYLWLVHYMEHKQYTLIGSQFLRVTSLGISHVSMGSQDRSRASVPAMPGSFSVVAMEVLSISCPHSGRQNCCRFQTLNFCFSRCQAGRSRPYVQNPALTLRTLPPRATMDSVRLGYPENMTSFNFASLSVHTHTHMLVLVMVTHCWVQSDFNFAMDCIWPFLTWLPCDIL